MFCLLYDYASVVCLQVVTSEESIVTSLRQRIEQLEKEINVVTVQQQQLKEYLGNTTLIIS